MGVSASTNAKGEPEHAVQMEITTRVRVEDIVVTAETAGRAILNIYNSDTSRWEVQIKADNSPVTLADKEANRVICDALQRLSPHIPIISEENGLPPYDVRKNYQYYWLVDPLDGTKEFLKRNGQFTINIALISDGVPVLGVVHVPVQAVTYWAVQGQGAWKREGGKQTQIKAQPFKLEAPGLNIVGSHSHMSPETKEFVELFKDPNFVQVGSSLKLLMVAEGKAHIYPRMAPTCEWDVAASDIIVREAGGVVLQAGECDENGKALEDWKAVLMKEQKVVYNKPNLLNPFFVVFGEKQTPPV